MVYCDILKIVEIDNIFLKIPTDLCYYQLYLIHKYHKIIRHICKYNNINKK